MNRRNNVNEYEFADHDRTGNERELSKTRGTPETFLLESEPVRLLANLRACGCEDSEELTSINIVLSVFDIIIRRKKFIRRF
jgi:hypothetical protein